MVNEKELKVGARLTWDNEYAMEEECGLVRVFPIGKDDLCHRTKCDSRTRSVLEVLAATNNMSLVLLKMTSGDVTDSFFLPIDSVVRNCTLVTEEADLESILEEEIPIHTRENTQIKYVDGTEVTKTIERVNVLESAAKYKVEVLSEAAGTPTEEKVSHPSHYTWLKDLCGIEVIDITRHMDFDLGNCVKYLLRAGHKKEEGYTDKEKALEDLKKAAWYLEDKIKMIENGR